MLLKRFVAARSAFSSEPRLASCRRFDAAGTPSSSSESSNVAVLVVGVAAVVAVVAVLVIGFTGAFVLEVFTFAFETVFFLDAISANGGEKKCARGAARIGKIEQ